MADEQSGTEQGDGGGAGQDMQRQLNSAIGKLSGPGEQLVVLGAILLVFVDIFGDFIFEEYFRQTYTQLLPAWFVIAAVVLHRFRGSALPVSYALVLAVLGFAAGFIGVRQLIQDLRDSIFDADAATVIFALVSWAGGILMLVGAIQLWPSAKNG